MSFFRSTLHAPRNRVVHCFGDFPVRSQGFIYTELSHLLDCGLPITILSRRRRHGELPAGLPGSSSLDVLSADEVLRPRFLFGASGIRIFAAVLARPVVSVRAVSAIIRRRGFNRSESRAALLGMAIALLAIDATTAIVHCQFATLAATVTRFRELGCFSAPIVVAIRGHDLNRALREFPRRPGAFFQAPDLFLPVSDDFRNQLIDKGCGPEKIAVHYTPLDVSRFVETKSRHPDSSLPSHPLGVLSVGRFVEKKGFEYTIRAIGILLARGYAVELSLVGDGPRFEMLRRLVVELGISQHVRFAGFLDQQALTDEYQRASIFALHAMTDSTGNQEGIPNVIKEAMASGLPVVSTLHAGIPEVVEQGETGILCRERNVEEFADALEQLYLDADFRRTLGANGRRRVEEQFNISSVTSQLVELYEKLHREYSGNRPGWIRIRRP